MFNKFFNHYFYKYNFLFDKHKISTAEKVKKIKSVLKKILFNLKKKYILMI